MKRFEVRLASMREIAEAQRRQFFMQRSGYALDSTLVLGVTGGSGRCRRLSANHCFVGEPISSRRRLLRVRHKISVSNVSDIGTYCIVPFSVERVGMNIDPCDLLF